MIGEHWCGIGRGGEGKGRRRVGEEVIVTEMDAFRGMK